MLFLLSYVALIFYIAYAGGFWVYPVLRVLNTVQRAVFIVICGIFGVCIYLVGEHCNHLVWGSAAQDTVTMNQKNESGKQRFNNGENEATAPSRKSKKKRHYV